MKFLIPLSLSTGLLWALDQSQILPIPAGTFEMGDHAGLGGGDTKHPSDEVPLHQVQITAFSMGKYEVTNAEYVEFLNDALAQKQVEEKNGYALWSATGDTLTLDQNATDSTHLSFNGTFAVKSDKEQHPIANLRWKGAIAYCNWASQKLGLNSVYNLSTGQADFSQNGIRLPSEAEWEYAALGGLKDPYPIFPWGNDTNQSGQYANWQNSGDPYESGTYPWTTPVGFYNGAKHLKSEFNWPGPQSEYQTMDAKNGYGLYDISGNVWEYANDWYLNPYYAQSPLQDPEGPSEAAAGAMPDGKKYKAMRGGNWYNGAEYYGHGRISNRNPSYFRGPRDPNHPYYHIGMRLATRTQFSTQTAIKNLGNPLRMSWSYDFVRIQGLSFAKAPELRIYDTKGNLLTRQWVSPSATGEVQIPLHFSPAQNIYPSLWVGAQKLISAAGVQNVTAE